MVTTGQPTPASVVRVGDGNRPTRPATGGRGRAIVRPCHGFCWWTGTPTCTARSSRSARPCSAPDGTPTGAAYAFLRMQHKLLRELAADPRRRGVRRRPARRSAPAWTSATRRSARRCRTTSGCRCRSTQEALRTARPRGAREADVEADDVIGTLAARAAAAGLRGGDRVRRQGPDAARARPVRDDVAHPPRAAARRGRASRRCSACRRRRSPRCWRSWATAPTTCPAARGSARRAPWS